MLKPLRLPRGSAPRWENYSIFPCQTCCCWTCDKGLLFATTNGDTSLAARQCRPRSGLWCPDPPFKHPRWGGVGLSAAVSAERHRRVSSSSQRGLFTCSFWSRVAIPPPPLFLPPASSGFLFSSSGAYHSFLHRCTPTPSCQAMKGYLRDDFFPVQQRTPPHRNQDCSYLCQIIEGLCNTHLVFSPVRSSPMLNKSYSRFSRGGTALRIAMGTSGDSAVV